MTQIMNSLFGIGTLLFAVASTASAQTSFPEIEPNGPKSEATPATCMDGVDTLDGTTTGSSTSSNNTSLTSADTFRVQTCALPLGIYAHQLVLTTSGTAGHTGTLRGLNQTGTVGVGGTAGTVDNALQTSTTATTPQRMNQWYGFGRSERIYYRVTGSGTTTQPYVATLSTTSVTATTIGPFTAGACVFTSIGQGHSTDTELALYDANLNAIAGHLNDDEYQGPSSQSRLPRSLSPGTYYLSVTNFPYCDNRVAAADEDWVSGLLTDFADVAVNGSTVAVMNVSFAVTDGVGATTPVLATKVSAWDILWFRFDVVPPSSITTFCVPGASGVMPCACANPNGAGVGCGNTGGPGGALAASGTPSVASDSILLAGSGMFSGSACVFLQGNAVTAGGTTFGAGIRCAGGSLKRLYVKPVSGGAASAPTGADPSVSARSAALGDVITSGLRWYQIHYRDPGLLNPGGTCPAIATFNVTAGQSIDWVP